MVLNIQANLLFLFYQPAWQALTPGAAQEKYSPCSVSTHVVHGSWYNTQTRCLEILVSPRSRVVQVYSSHCIMHSSLPYSR